MLAHAGAGVWLDGTVLVLAAGVGVVAGGGISRRRKWPEADWVARGASGRDMQAAHARHVQVEDFMPWRIWTQCHPSNDLSAHLPRHKQACL